MSSKTKYIQNKFYLVQHLVEEERLRTRHVGTNDMIADAMTKPLPENKFDRCRDGMKVLRIERSRLPTGPVGALDRRRK
jgi:hypothetical protein